MGAAHRETHRGEPDVLNIVVEPTPDGVNPYAVPGSSGVPRILHRVMDTPDQLKAVIAQTMFYRGIDRTDLCRATGLPLPAVSEVLDSGCGALSDIRKMLDALGIKPVSLPGPPYVRIG